MKYFCLLFTTLLSITLFSQNKDTIKINNDTTEYEISIIDAGFNSWLISYARPRGFYGLNYLEFHNNFYVNDWNFKFMSSNRRNLYNFYIDYNPSIKYGYEVNYILFNYFQYFMFVTGEKLGVRRR